MTSPNKTPTLPAKQHYLIKQQQWAQTKKHTAVPKAKGSRETEHMGGETEQVGGEKEQVGGEIEHVGGETEHVEGEAEHVGGVKITDRKPANLIDHPIIYPRNRDLVRDNLNPSNRQHAHSFNYLIQLEKL